jgi:CRISPR-associated protein Cas4
VTLSSARLGLIAKIDLVEGSGTAVTPVDYKRGKRPHVPKGAYDPERVQLCIQGMLLEEHGYEATEGVLYFVEGKERVRVPFDEELRALTRNAVDGLRLIAVGGTIPPPLENSPKCPRCSLVGICLPDEVNFLRREEDPPRPLAVGRDEAMPMYVQANRAKVARNGETLEVSIEDKVVNHARINEVSQLVLMGNVYLTTPCLQELMNREVPVTWMSYGGWFMGHTIGTGHKNVELRTAQYRESFDERRCLALAKGLVEAKILNGRTLLRRNWRPEEKPEALLDGMKQDAEAARLEAGAGASRLTSPRPKSRGLIEADRFSQTSSSAIVGRLRDTLRHPTTRRTVEYPYAHRTYSEHRTTVRPPRRVLHCRRRLHSHGASIAPPGPARQTPHAPRH